MTFSMRWAWATAGIVLAALGAGGACSATPNVGTGGGGAGGGGTGAQTSQGGNGEGGLGIAGQIEQGGSPPVVSCKVLDDDAQNAPTCTEIAPADSFEPQVQWEFVAPNGDPNGYVGSFSTPLVGNFTDDNADGSIDLCDIPDVLVTTISSFVFDGVGVVAAGQLFMLAGDTGAVELQFSQAVDAFVYSAFGDIDNDGLPEIITATDTGHLVAFEHDGTLKWMSPNVGGYRNTLSSSQCVAIAIYDLQADGTPEILFGWELYDANGNMLWSKQALADPFNGTYWCATPTAADLDNDGKLEVVHGRDAYRWDGTQYYTVPSLTPAHPQIANLDSDPEPEIFLTTQDGISVLEHTGQLKFGPVKPTSPQSSPNCWGKPAVVQDFDGDGISDIAAATCSDYTMYGVGPSGVTPKWTNNVSDLSGLATATGFDFLGDGVAEALYADETQIYAFDGKTGMTTLTAPRSSGTLIEYPVVADVDNDGSAEILYVSNYYGGLTPGPTLTVLRDAEERWIPARRIWNQYSYHVTNVREDGTIPKNMKKNWELLNTFRTNSQINGSGVDCDPGEPPK